MTQSPEKQIALPRVEHGWDLTPGEAIALQKCLREHVVVGDCHGPIARVAGVDVGFEKNGKITRAAVCVFSWPDLTLLEDSTDSQPTRLPYIPGLLSFREIPAILGALDKLVTPPDLLMCDGHGIAHPRRVGIAAHLGLYTGIPALGVGKSRLTGKHEKPGENKGDQTPLLDNGERIGTVVRTRDRVKPVYVSPGHGVSHHSAVRLVLEATTRYRLPETTRRADKLASRRFTKRRS